MGHFNPHSADLVNSNNPPDSLIADLARTLHRDDRVVVIDLRGLSKQRLRSWSAAKGVSWESIKINRWRLGVYDLKQHKLVGFLRPKEGSKGYSAKLCINAYYELEFFGELSTAANRVLLWAQSKQ